MAGSNKPIPSPAPDLPGHWRRVLTITYAHLQRKEVSQIKTKEGTGIKRVNINIPTDLHNAFKSTTAAQGLEMTVVLLEFIEKYVAKNGPRKGRRG
jgi:ParG